VAGRRASRGALWCAGFAAALLVVAIAGAPANGDPAPAFTEVAGSPFAADGGPASVSISKDGKLLAAANFGTVTVFSVAADGTLTPVSGSPFSVGTGPKDATFSPNGKLLAVANATSQSISLFSVSGSTLTPVAGSPFSTVIGVENVVFNPAGTLIAATDFSSDAVDLLAVSGSGTSTVLTEVTDAPFTVVGAGTPGFSSEGTLLAVPDYTDNEVVVYAVSGTGTAATLTEAAASPVATGAGPVSASFSPVAGVLAVANSADNTISMFAAGGSGTGTTLSPATGSPFTTGRQPNLAAFNAAGTLLASANQVDDKVSVFAVSGQGVLTQVAGSPFATDYLPSWVAFSPTGGLLATADGVGNDVSVFAVAPPTASISSPVTGGYYRVSQVVATAYACSDGAYGPGVVPAACKDNHGGSGTSGTLSTAITGPHTYTVTATSKDGQTAHSSISYTVDGTRPTVTLTTPPDSSRNYAAYSKNAVVIANYACHDNYGIATCAGPVATGAPIDTSSLGLRPFHVDAADLAGNHSDAANSVTRYYVCPADGSGQLTAIPAVVPANSLQAMTFRYWFPAGCVWRGALTLTAPNGWTAPNAVGASTPGYTRGFDIHSSLVALTLHGQTITMGGVGLTTELSSPHEVTIIYGSVQDSGKVRVGPTTGATTWHPKVKTTGGGTLAALAEPGIFVTAADGTGTMTPSKTTVKHSAQGQTIVFTYTASGPLRDATLTLQVPPGWSGPAVGSNTLSAGYTTSSVGTLTISSRTINVAVPTLGAGQKVTVTYGDKSGGGPGATAPKSTGAQTWPALERSAVAGALTALAAQPSITVN
jgi:6-phosphogluconolactonase (cycloisomerase 2 family)